MRELDTNSGGANDRLDRLCREARRDGVASGVESRGSVMSPLGILQDDAVTIPIFVCPAAGIPVWIERVHLLKPRGQHVRAGTVPLGGCRQVEDCQVFGSGRWSDGTDSAVRELEVVVRTIKSEHDTIESFMVLEAADNAKTQPPAVHGLGSRQIADWPGNSKMEWHGG